MAGAAGAVGSAETKRLPQKVQNIAPAVLGLPQLGQTSPETGGWV